MACTANPCSSGGAGDQLALACEKTDTILSIAAVGIDYAVPSCTGGGNFSTATSSVCNLAAVQQAIESACNGQVSCELSATTLINTGACSAVSSGSLRVFARVTCAEETGLDTLTILILILYFAISFGLGATLFPAYFREIIRNKKRAFFIGWLSQFGFMPLMAFVSTHIFQLCASPSRAHALWVVASHCPTLPASRSLGRGRCDTLRRRDNRSAIGVIMCGMAPGGMTSNLLTYWVNGNVALSISMSVASTTCCMLHPLSQDHSCLPPPPRL